MSAENSAKVTCVFVHGWAMNSAVWETFLPLLPDWIEVIRLDLPGHGAMDSVSATSLDDKAGIPSRGEGATLTGTSPPRAQRATLR